MPGLPVMQESARPPMATPPTVAHATIWLRLAAIRARDVQAKMEILCRPPVPSCRGTRSRCPLPGAEDGGQLLRAGAVNVVMVRVAVQVAVRMVMGT